MGCLKLCSCPYFVSESTLILFVFFRSFNVRKAVTNDLEGIKTLVETLSLNERILDDSKISTEARREPVSICCCYVFKSVLRSGLDPG